MTSAQIAVEVVQLLEQAEDARMRLTKIKGRVSRKIKLGIYMAKMAIKKLAIWTTKSDNLEATREGNERAALFGRRRRGPRTIFSDP